MRSEQMRGTTMGDAEWDATLEARKALHDAEWFPWLGTSAAERDEACRIALRGGIDAGRDYIVKAWAEKGGPV